MTAPYRLKLRKIGLTLGATACLALMAGCAGTKVFEGQTAFAVNGTPPAAPAPPPPPAPEPPKEEPKRVELKADKIEIREKIQFEYNSANIKAESDGLITEIADVIKKNPHVKKIAIEGHASSEGNAGYNKTLSDKRAKAVMAALVGKGVEATRLTAKGFGSEKPISTNDTEEGREANRRVEFNITEQDAKAPDTATPAAGSVGALKKPGALKAPAKTEEKK
ncbi:MAG: OmpA family protein [Polyangiaceae bacterium]